jgi:hypothetical protein
MYLLIVLLVFGSPLLVLWAIGAWRSKRDSPPVALTPRQRRNRILSYVLSGCFGLGLLFWPVAAASTLFAVLGQGSPVEWLLVGAFVISIWCYPLLWAAGIFFGTRSVKRDEATWLVVLKSSIPLCSGLWIVVLVVAVAFFQELWPPTRARPNEPPAAVSPAE